MVIIIVPELEFDDAGSREAVASILARLSLLAGSADPGEEAPPRNKKIAKTEAKHNNLTTRLNVLSNHLGQGALNCRDLFFQKTLSPKIPTPIVARLSRRSPYPRQQKTSRRNSSPSYPCSTHPLTGRHNPLPAPISPFLRSQFSAPFNTKSTTPRRTSPTPRPIASERRLDKRPRITLC